MGRILTPPSRTPEGADGHLADLVARGVREGIISSEQAARLLALAPARPSGPGEPTGAAVPARAGRLRAYVAEALGYVGAALVVVAGLVTVQQFWDDLAAGVHVTLWAGLAVALVATGALVRGEDHTPLGRLGSFLWLLAVGAVAGTSMVVGEEVVGLEEAALGVATTVPATLVAGVLWSLRLRSLQQVAAVVGLLASATALLSLGGVELEDWGWVLVWGVGVAWLLLAWQRVVSPVRTAQVVGAVVALLGALVSGGTGWGTVLGVVTAGALVAGSVVVRETVLLGLGVLGLFVFVPQLVFRFFGDELGAPVALLLSGGLLLAVALWIARARREGPGE